MVFESDRPFDAAQFESFIENSLPVSVVRAKGTLWLEGVPRGVIFHLVGRRTNPFETVTAKTQPIDSRLVLIGRGIDQIQLKSDLEGLLVPVS